MIKPMALHALALVTLLSAGLSAGVVPSLASDAPSSVVAELAPSARLRAAINYGNLVLAQKDSATGEPRGVTAELSRELGRRLGVPVDFVPFDQAGKVFDALAAGAWDIAFLAIDPARAAWIDFTAPYVVIEGNYLVQAGSPLRSVADVDRDGVRIAVARASAYDLYLTRTLKHATLVRAPDGVDALEMFLAETLDAAAGVKQPIVAFAASHPELRVIETRFMVIEQAMGTPKGRKEGARYLARFVEEMKASGFVARALAASGQADAAVAPPSPAE
jgi:polar amino acid transport system substrate-binding protein